MKRLLGLLLGIVGKEDSSTAEAAQSTAAEDASPVAELENLGAKVMRNEQGQVIFVSLDQTKVTDAGLVHLKELPSRQYLELVHAKIGDAGLMQLKRLTNLTDLFRMRNQITDAGLVHLKELASLEFLGLTDTKVTDAGVAELQKALPNCRISK